MNCHISTFARTFRMLAWVILPSCLAFANPQGGGVVGLTTLVEFNYTTAPKGLYPQGSLVEGADGNFYGTTQYGGANDQGTVFQMTPDGVLTTLVEFNNDLPPKGANPTGNLVVGMDGNFYGLTQGGGANFAGTAFRMTPAGVLTTLVEFKGGAAPRGRDPEGSLLLGSDGNFYGVTAQGGVNGRGTAFSMTPAGVLTTLVDFNRNTAPKGEGPRGSLVQGTDGNLYGMTTFGGAFGQGTVFQLTPAGVLVTLVEFNGSAVPKGSGPYGSLTLGSDGNFYGTTGGGGVNGGGTAFRVTPSGVLSTLVEFNDNFAPKGASPYGTLVEGADGDFYGVTFRGGENGNGTVFKMTPAGVLNTLIEFNDATAPKGSLPFGGLIQGSDGNFYGMTFTGGANGDGTVFRLSTVSPPNHTWIGGSGDWNNPVNWSPSGVPGAADAVTINQGTVTMNANVSVQVLTINGGTLTGTGDITVDTQFDWSNGNITGSGSITLGPNVVGTISATGTRTFGGGRTLINNGTLTWNATGGIYFNDGTFINNGTFEVQNNLPLLDADGAGTISTFVNNGTFRKTIATGLSIYTISSFINNGTFDLQSGAITMHSPFANDGTARTSAGILRLERGGSGAGAFDAIGTGIVEFASDTFTLSSGAQLTGDGLHCLDGGTLVAQGTTTASRLKFSSGVLQIEGALTVIEFLDWSGGAINGGGAFTLANTVTANIHGTGNKILDGGTTFANAGSIVWTDGGGLVLNAGTFNNSGTFESQTDAAIYDADGAGTASSLVNSGTLRKTTATGNSPVQLGTVINTGTLDVQSGSVTIQAPFDNNGLAHASAGTLILTQGGTSIGTYQATGAGVVEYAGGVLGVGNGTQLVGTGLHRLQGGSLSVDGNVTVDKLEINGGVLLGGGALIVQTLFTWNGGTLTGAGSLDIAATCSGNICGYAAKIIDGGKVINNAGSLIWNSGNSVVFRQGTFNNSGRIDAVTDAALYDDDGPATASLFNNSGTFLKSSGAGMSSFTISLVANTGTVDAQFGTVAFHSPFSNSGTAGSSGGVLLISAGGVSDGLFQAATPGKVQFSGGAYTLNTGARLMGTGLHRLSSGTLFMAGTVTAERLQIDGGLMDVAGAISVGTTFNWTRGTINGPGLVTITGTGSGAISGPENKLITGGCSLNNSGTLAWTDAGKILLREGVINNAGTIETQTDASLEDDDNPATMATLINSGIIRKTGATGVTDVRVARFDNTGTVDLRAGSMTVHAPFNNGGAASASSGTLTLNRGGNSGGTFNAAGTGVVEFSGGTHLIGGGAQFTGTGLHRINGATFTVGGTVNAERIEFNGGVLNGTGSLIASSLFNWNGGTMTDSGTTTLTAGGSGTLGGSVNKILEGGRTFNNAGTLLWSGNGNFFLREGVFNNTGIVDTQNDAVLVDDNPATAGTFNNMGTFRKSVATGTTRITGVVFNNSGTLDLRRGILSFVGNYTTLSGSVHRFAIGGAIPAMDFGQLNATGSIDLTGSLDVSLVNQFVPAKGSTFQVVTAGSLAGTFGSTGGLVIAGDLSFVVGYQANGVLLTAGVSLPSFDASMASYSGGQFHLSVNGQTGSTYVIDASTDLMNWMEIGRHTYTGETWDFADTDVASHPAGRFYRVRLIPAD